VTEPTTASEHYAAERSAASERFASLSDRELATRVPACPAWTVRDVLSHMVGVTADVCSQTMDGAGGPAWTQAQVDARVGATVDQVLEEWAKRSVGFEQALPEMGFLGWVFLMDLTMHHDDVREALGRPLGSSATNALVLERLVGQAGKRAEGVGTLTLRVGPQEWTVGSGTPTASVVVADTQELARVLGGRRTDDQVRALDWTGEAQPWLPVLPLFRDGR
jgi:uncharacterized protein (TIGR03083 family)